MNKGIDEIIKMMRAQEGLWGSVELTPDDAAELIAALEQTQAQSSKWLEAYHKAVSIGARYEKRIAELEAASVKPVKLPRIFWYEHDDLSRDVPVMNAREVKKAIRDAGGKVEGE